MQEHRNGLMPGRRGVLAATGAAGLLMLSPRAGRAQAGRAANRNTLKAVVHADLKILDPVWTTAYITQRHSLLVYDTLYAVDSKFEPKPQMVEGHTLSPDGLTYVFTLRPGLKFHDGQPVRAADCVASVKRWAARDNMGQILLGFLDRMEVADERSFRIVLKEPFGLLLDALGKSTSAPYIMPERLANTPPTEQVTDATGSGPFIFKRDEWRPGNRAVYVRNPDYVPRAEPPDYLAGGKIPKMERIEWIYIPDNNTVLSALMAGEIDYFEAPPLDFIGLLKDTPDVTVLNIDTLGVQGLIRPNTLYPPFDKFEGRQALLHTIDQAEYMGAVVGNPDLFLPFCGAYFLCSSANDTAVGSEPLRKPDYAKARQMLASAGYKAGDKMVVLQPTDRPQYSAATTVLASGLRKAGVNVDLQAADWSTITARRARRDPPDKGGWNLFITTHGGPDVTAPISNVWFNSKCERANPGWACDPELEALNAAWAREPDRAKRHAMIEGIQRRAYTSVPYVPFGQFFQPIAFRKNVKGVLAAGQPVYWNIEKS